MEKQSNSPKMTREEREKINRDIIEMLERLGIIPAENEKEHGKAYLAN